MNFKLIFSFLLVFLVGIVIGYFISISQVEQPEFLINTISGSCTYSGKTYESGDSFPAEDGCNQCGCENGEVICSTIACVKE